MKRVFPALGRALIALAFLSAPAFAVSERIVEIGAGDTRFVGAYMEAQQQQSDDAGAPAPVVLMLHGFTGDRSELEIAGTDETVFLRAARLLSEAGFDSFRIDFRGSGESDALAWEDTTFSTQIVDAKAAIDYLADNNDGAPRPVIVLGYSQGGLIAAHAVAARPDVAAAVLWAPVAIPQLTYAAVLGDDVVEAMQAADEDAPAREIELPWGETTRLKPAFFNEFLRTDPVAAIAPWPGPLLVVVGGNDDIVGPQPKMGMLYLRYHEGPSEMKVYMTDHIFGAFEGPETLDRVVSEMVPWLRSALDGERPSPSP